MRPDPRIWITKESNLGSTPVSGPAPFREPAGCGSASVLPLPWPIDFDCAPHWSENRRSPGFGPKVLLLSPSPPWNRCPMVQRKAMTRAAVAMSATACSRNAATVVKRLGSDILVPLCLDSLLVHNSSTDELIGHNVKPIRGLVRRLPNAATPSIVAVSTGLRSAA